MISHGEARATVGRLGLARRRTPSTPSTSQAVGHTPWGARSNGSITIPSGCDMRRDAMRRALTLAAALCVGMLLAPRTTFAEDASANDGATSNQGRLEELRRLMDEAEYRRGLSVARAVIEGGGLTPPELAEAYVALATCSAAFRRRDDTRDAFIKVLAINPLYSLPNTASPLLRRPLRRAQAFWTEKRRPSIRLEPPERLLRGEVFVVEPDFEPGDLPELVTEMTLHLRQPDGSYAIYIGVDGRIEIPPGDLEGLDTIEYFVAGRDQYGNIVTSAGAPSAPLRLALVDPAPEPEPELAVDEPLEPLRPRRRWFRRWWVWTIVGVAVAGAATGLALGLSDLEPSPCSQSIGEACDYSARVIP